LSEPFLRCRGLTKRFGETLAVDGVDLDVEQGHTYALLGPSGCGKTTLLRMIAGFEHADSGSVELGGRTLSSGSVYLPAERRRIGMVFQDYALFPHLTVEANVMFGITEKTDKRVRASEVLEVVGLGGLGGRMPHELSGGQQQRVALARSLAVRPELVLLDEPFSNLDPAMRVKVRTEVRQIIEWLGITALFVTHDQEEALSIGDRVAVMKAGRIQQVATPGELLRAPASEFVARFLGYQNLLPLDGALGRSLVGEVATNGVLLIPEEAIRIDPSGRSEATVSATRRRGRQSDVWAIANGELLHLSVAAIDAEGMAEGDPVALEIDPERVHVISEDR